MLDTLCRPAPAGEPMRLRALLLLTVVVLPLAAAAEAPRYLLRADEVCDTERDVCLRGSLIHYPDSNRIELSARVIRAPGPGWLRILFAGVDDGGHRGSTVLEFPIRGRYSEIVRKSFIPDPPSLDHWRVLGVIFTPDEAAARAARDLQARAAPPPAGRDTHG